MVSPQIQILARRLIALEAARPVESSGGSDVAVRVVEHIRGRLIRLVGVQGYRSLLSRVLTLAKTESPALGAVLVGADGTLENLAEIENDESAGSVLVAQLLGLLTTFIGESLTLQLVRDSWPEAAQPASGAPTAKTPAADNEETT